MSKQEFLATQKLIRLRDQWFPRVVVAVTETGFRYSRFRDNQWREVESLLETRSVFEQRVLLIPDAFSFFRLRQFPFDAVNRQHLREAVELDLARWSPYSEDADFYFWPKRCGDSWQVAVWVWDHAELKLVLDKLATSPTHIIPERAWKIASLDVDHSDFILVDQGTTGDWTYTGVLEDFSSIRTAAVTNEADAKRFKAAFGSDGAKMPLFVGKEANSPVIAWENEQDVLDAKYVLPDTSALAASRQPGIRDWSDPFVWAKPIGAIVVLYIFLLLSSGIVLLKQGEDLLQYSAQARSVSVEVLNAREEVERINVLLESVGQQRSNQTRLESLLAVLSVSLPRNAWLEHVEYRSDDGGWLEITGKSEQSSSLAATLEQMPEVEHAMFLTDIRKDKATGLEPFKIRLKLATVRQ